MNLVIIGSSTGGVRTLEKIFNGVPKLDCAIVIIQHISSPFDQKLAENLDHRCDMDVQCCLKETQFQLGHIYIAPGNFHLKFKGVLIGPVEGDLVNYVKPAIDATMMSYSQSGGDDLTAIMLTGMGEDGLRGVQYLKSIATLEVIAQTKESCSVYGIPKNVIEAGLVDKVLSPHEIRQYLLKKFAVK